MANDGEMMRYVRELRRAQEQADYWHKVADERSAALNEALSWNNRALDVLTVLATEKPNIPLSGVGYCMFCGADLPKEKHDDDCSYVRARELVKEHKAS